MTTYIFFDNQTSGQFNLNDADQNFFAVIPGGWMSSVKINYSQSFEKQYNLTLVDGGHVISFWLSVAGGVSRVNTGSGIAKLQIAYQGTSCKTLNVNNKLIILPNLKSGNSLPYAPKIFVPKVSQALLLADKY
jgi:hypothetical protein